MSDEYDGRDEEEGGAGYDGGGPEGPGAGAGRDESGSSPQGHGDRDKKRKKDGEEWWEERTTGEKVALGILFGILGAGFLALVGFVTMSLWNALMPEIFGLKEITYWQTWGLLILSAIFFKNWGGGKESGSRKDRKRKRELRRYMREEQRRNDEGLEA